MLILFTKSSLYNKGDLHFAGRPIFLDKQDSLFDFAKKIVLDQRL